MLYSSSAFNVDMDNLVDLLFSMPSFHLSETANEGEDVTEVMYFLLIIAPSSSLGLKDRRHLVVGCDRRTERPE